MKKDIAEKKRVRCERLERFPTLSPPVSQLFGIGDMTLLEQPRLIAVVGTRNPSAYGRGAAKAISQFLARRGAVVVSGMARGIDAVAHHSVLEVKGMTIGVSAVCPSAVYPALHLELYRRMWSSGLIVSEHEELDRPAPYHFPLRNRIIAGLSDGVIVVEAGAKSGALITAQYAIEVGLPVLAVPGSIFHSQSKGCHRLIEEGAHVLHEVEQLEAMFQLSKSQILCSLSEDARLIHNTMEDHVEFDLATLIDIVDMPLPDVIAAINELLQEGWLVETAVDRYRRIDA